VALMKKPARERRTSYADWAYRQIRDAIIWWDLQPREMISENQLAKKLHISRTPVREALLRLQREGLVEIKPQRGAFVSPIRVNEVLQARLVREVLEVTAVKEGFDRIGADELLAMEKALDDQEKAALARDFRAFIDADEGFHQVILDAAQNEKLKGVVAQMRLHLLRVRVWALPVAERFRLMIEDHKSIYEAYRERDLELAVARMESHLRRTKETCATIVNQNPFLCT
jgi:DNA-binding GntR family transcriptional regulator